MRVICSDDPDTYVAVPQGFVEICELFQGVLQSTNGDDEPFKISIARRTLIDLFRLYSILKSVGKLNCKFLMREKPDCYKIEDLFQEQGDLGTFLASLGFEQLVEIANACNYLNAATC